MKRAQAIKSSAFELGQQIGDLRRVAFKTQLALNTGSILGIKFWAPVVQPSEDDVQRLDQFNAEMKAARRQLAGRVAVRHAGVAGAGGDCLVPGRYFSERFRPVQHPFPAGRAPAPQLHGDRYRGGDGGDHLHRAEPAVLRLCARSRCR